MATCIEINPTIDAIAKAVNLYMHCVPMVQREDIRLKFCGYDSRIDSDVYMVVVAGIGVCGYTDSEVASNAH